MIRSIQRFAIQRPVATAMFYLALMLVGALSFRELKVSLLPAIEYPRVTIVTAYASAAPEEVENLITRPVSEAVGTVGGVEKVTSESMEGVSTVTLQFGWGTNIDFAIMEVRERVDLIRGNLPQDAGRPVVTRFDPAQAPIMEIVFLPGKIPDARDLRHQLDREARVFLERVDGVGMVRLSGGYKKEIQVNVDHSALVAHGLSLERITEAVSEANLNFPAGHITVGDKDVLIRSMGEFKDLEDLRRAVIGTNERGVPVNLSSVAEVKAGYRDRKGLARYNGQECVTASVYRESGKNTVEVAEGLLLEIENIQRRFHGEFSVQVVYSEADFITNSVNNLLQAIVIGALLSFAALLLILRNLRSPFIVVTAVPISLLVTFGFMYAYDISLNMMSLGGLELSIGLLFDSSNVVLSAIERHRQAGLSPREAALRGATEVSSSVTSAILTTVIVFVPILFLKSIVGVVFKEMALTITISSLVSLVVALTLVPMLCSLRLGAVSASPPARLAGVLARSQQVESRISRSYENALAIVLDNPRKFIVPVAALTVVGIVLFPFIRREFTPAVDTGEFGLEIESPPGTALARSAETAAAVEGILLKSGIRHAVTLAGIDEEQLLRGTAGTHTVQMRVVLPDASGTRQFTDRLLASVPLANDVKMRPVHRGDVIADLLSPEARGISLELAGDDMTALKDLGRRIQADLQKVDGITFVETSLDTTASEVHLTFDTARTAKAGFTNTFLARYLRTSLEGSIATSLHRPDDEIDIRVRMRESDRASIERLESLRLPSGERSIYLGQIATLEDRKGNLSILRSGPTRINRITAEAADGVDVLPELEVYRENTRLPPGYSLEFAGEKENIDRSFRELAFAFILSVILVYMLLAAQFESFLVPAAMLSTIPVMTIGIIPALLLSGKALNVSSFTGIILLVGIVVDNASLLFEYIELLIEEGLDIRSAVLEAGKIVLRPLAMNNGTNMLGLIPVALEFGQGTEFQSPMAITVISGLFASAGISLFLVPALFYLILQRKKAA